MLFQRHGEADGVPGAGNRRGAREGLDVEDVTVVMRDVPLALANNVNRLAGGFVGFYHDGSGIEPDELNNTAIHTVGEGEAALVA